MFISAVANPSQLAALNQAIATSTIQTEAAEAKTALLPQGPLSMEKPVAIEAYVKKYFADEPLLIRIAKCESTFRQFDENGNVLRGEQNKDDVGLMQINEKFHLERAIELGYDIYSIDGNLAYAKYLYENEGAAPWSASSKCWKSKTNAQLVNK